MDEIGTLSCMHKNNCLIDNWCNRTTNFYDVVSLPMWTLFCQPN